jgi:hypothetical protein
MLQNLIARIKKTGDLLGSFGKDNLDNVLFNKDTSSGPTKRNLNSVTTGSNLLSEIRQRRIVAVEEGVFPATVQRISRLQNNQGLISNFLDSGSRYVADCITIVDVLGAGRKHGRDTLENRGILVRGFRKLIINSAKVAFESN